MSVRDGSIRSHQPVDIDKLGGLWDRGDPDNTPLDHFQQADNIKFVGTNTIKTRDGVGLHQSVGSPLSGILRAYNYPTQDANTVILLVENGAGDGEIYHIVDESTAYGPLLTITGMRDFGFIPFAGRAYITPFSSFANGSLNVEKGLEDEFLYVYMGDGTPARKAAGLPPTGNVTVSNGAAGNTDPGLHLFGVVFESDTGWLSAPAAFAQFTTVAALSVTFTNIPVSGESHITKRHIVATKKIASFNGDLTGYQYFFIPGATVPDNSTTTLSNISFFDADLLEDTSHLLDNYAEIPAGVGLTLYHNRLCLHATFDDISIVLVSTAGEPEAISQIDGLIIAPLDGNPITNVQELRDVLYVFKRARTLSYIDNGEEPSAWPLTIIDNALGCPVHGIATVLDSGSASVDYLIVASYKGISLFNGQYSSPELTWKIQNAWFELDRNGFRRMQILNDPTNQRIYVVLKDGRLLVGDYKNGMDPKNIRWAFWSFYFNVSSIALVNIDELILGGIIPDYFTWW